MADTLQPTKPVLDRSTELALARTRAAYDRTMMAWIRTATSLITFGFTVYKFFQIERPRGARPVHLIGPRDFAIALVSIGLFALVLATLENRQNMKTLRAEYTQTLPLSLSGLAAAAISLLGIAALILIVLRQ